jgi:hypothetical protein
MKTVRVVFAYLVGMYLVVRAIVELVTIDYGDAASYEDDWGGPSLAGVLAVHCLPGVIAVSLMILGAAPPVCAETPSVNDAPAELAEHRRRSPG